MTSSFTGISDENFWDIVSKQHFSTCVHEKKAVNEEENKGKRVCTS